MGKVEAIRYIVLTLKDQLLGPKRLQNGDKSIKLKVNTYNIDILYRDIILDMKPLHIRLIDRSHPIYILRKYCII